MLSSGNNTTGKRTLRGLKSVFGISSPQPASNTINHTNNSTPHQAYDWVYSPRTPTGIVSHNLLSLQLPPSMPSLDNVSPGLWEWIHASDNIYHGSQLDLGLLRSAGNVGSNASIASSLALPSISTKVPFYTRVFSPAGDLLEIPNHLMEPTAPFTSSVSTSMLHQTSAAAAAEACHSLAAGLTRSSTLDAGRSPTSMSGSSMSSKRRKPVQALSPSKSTPTSLGFLSAGLDLPPLPSLYQQEKPQVKHFFVQLIDVNLSKIPSGDHVIGIVSVGNGRRCTSILPLRSDHNAPKGFQHACHPYEGFIFDIPNSQEDVIIAIRLYSKLPDAEDPHGGTKSPTGLHSASMESFSSHASGFKKSTLSFFGSGSSHGSSLSKRTSMPASGYGSTFKQFQDQEALRFPAPPTALDTLIGEMTLTLPTQHAFSKVAGTYALTLNGGKKEVAKINIQMGMFVEEKFTPVREIPSGMYRHDDTLNFLLRTPGGMIWKKYFVVGTFDGIRILDTEYLDRKDPIAWLHFSQIVDVAPADFEFMAAPNCMRITISMPWTDDDRVATSPLNRDWREAVIGGAAAVSRYHAVIYVTGDNLERAFGWLQYFRRLNVV
ncbi:hypothetical protein BASA50_005657 [Batrachochytrium salamandrivorans]|uniref:Uncharacterized protein n=1 Tax=Batrachochytrium salamandrivorans TaxID=1357716 RepID=A0ABQ8FC42_9FUNG|nr:hypothetical protein BASA60_011491 [Batrachochytrium salamandrivorans]KAH6562760.1 hypothetical protein BASA62_008954 [Batrachochytrium salamandrivorans]KAH6584605.1 hypothetical protein BASA61_007351 [Batrachochytrium salamandrivorans]KAH6595701.1 hypothetical protein BASA50_005657 [Batrachochytrium salamandrivorans]KAH9248808.1 hypothetical protein BASA81_013509 [Batrachochytrium salamandrivorans]